MVIDKRLKMNIGILSKIWIVIFFAGCLFLAFPIASSSSSEGQIVFAREGGAGNGVWVVDDSGKNEKRIYPHWGLPAWSPDGKLIAYSAYSGELIQDAEFCDIYVMNADGSNIKRITFDGPECDDIYPAWSPDGTQIAFSREIWGKKDTWNIVSNGIYVMDSDGANMKRLTESFDRSPDWSPDGKKIAYYLANWNGPGQIWVMNADGGNRKMIYDWGYFPDWSPDGTKIVFSSERFAWQAGQGITCDICVMDIDGLNVKVLTEPGPSGEFYPRWSPDGKKIVFSSDRDCLNNHNYSIYIMNADGSDIQRITTNTTGWDKHPDWTPFPSYSVYPSIKLINRWGEIKTKQSW